MKPRIKPTVALIFGGRGCEHDVSVEGAKYPLKNARLSRRNAGFGTSNEIDGNCALISLKKGSLFVIESRDA